MTNATTRFSPAPASTAVDGLFHLLVRSERHGDAAQRYSEGEMAELFTPDERALLATGESLTCAEGDGLVIWVDMVAAARAALA